MKLQGQLIVAVIFSVLLAGTAFAKKGKRHHHRTSGGDNHGTLLGVGDSVTAGEGVTEDKIAKWGYAALLTKALNDTDAYEHLDLLNLAVPGYRTADVIAQLSVPATQYAIATSDVKVITMTVGGNDLRDALNAGAFNACFVPGYELYCQQAAGAVFADVGGRYSYIVGMLSALAPGAEIVLVEQFNPLLRTGCDPMGIAATATQLLGAWNAAVVAPTASYFQAQYVATLVPFILAGQAFLSDQDLRLDDGVPQLDCLHPGKAGHEYIAGAAAAALTAP